jgi:hypothetical protein
MAKLKQIAIEPGAGDDPGVMWGLCKDGSLWMRPLLLRSAPGEWLRVDTPATGAAMPVRRKRAAEASMSRPANMRISGGMSGGNGEAPA